LDLGGLVTLDADTAQALAEFDGVALQLNKLIKVDAESEKVLKANRKIEFVSISVSPLG
jgi:hypothetical protein